MSLSPVSVERLTKLADVLDAFPTYIAGGTTPDIDKLAVPVEKFNLRQWSCGTAACAGGVAMFHPWFRKRGLRHRNVKLLADNQEHRYPYFKGESHLVALQKFFHIDKAAASFIFMPAAYPRSHQQSKYVADRIRKFVERGGTIVSPTFKHWIGPRF